MRAIQCKMARVALGLGVRDLAKLACVSADTVARLERGEALKPRTVVAIKSTLESAGVVFLEEGNERFGVVVKDEVKND